MKKHIMNRMALSALTLVLILGLLPLSGSVFAADTVYKFEDLTPATMYFTESTEAGYDYVTTTDAYDCCAYYIDLAYLLKDFDIDEYLKKYETGYIVMKNENFDAQVHFSTDGGKQYGPKIPREEVVGKDRYDDDIIQKYYRAKICEFSRDDKTAYEELCTFGSTAIFVDVTKGPVVLELLVTSNQFWYVTDGEPAYSKTIKITGDYILNAIKSIDIYDFDFTGKHGATLDTDARSNMGSVVSIKYLDENKKNERSTLVAGDKGYIEFTIVMLQHCYYVDYRGDPHTITYDWEYSKAHWDTTVQSHLKGGSYSGVETNSSSFITYEDNKYLIKLYHAYEIPENSRMVIRQGTINLTAPTDGATADKTVKLENIKDVPTGRGNRTEKQFRAGDATWLTLDSRGRMKSVKSFSAGNIYIALVKLEPYANFYFNESSAEKIQVPGASKFTIGYMRTGDYDYIKEDGYYLAASFPKVKSNYFDISISYDKPEMTVPQGSSSYLTALSSYDLSKATDVQVQWYYSSDISKDKVGELCAASDGDLRLQVDTSAKGTSYYRCVVSCKVNGAQGRITYPASEWAKVTVTEKTSNPLTLSAVGKQSVSITQKGQTVTFEVTAKNATGNVNYTWYECDASGKLVDDVAIGTGKKLVVSGIDGNYGDSFYYKCVARDSKGSDSVMFTATVLYDKEVSLPTSSQPDTSAPETTEADTPETGEPDTGTPDSSNPEESEPDSTEPDAGNTETTEPDASEPSPSDSDSGRPDTGNSSDDGETGGGMPVWLIVILVAVGLGGAAAAVVVILKKKKQ